MLWLLIGRGSDVMTRLIMWIILNKSTCTVSLWPCTFSPGLRSMASGASPTTSMLPREEMVSTRKLMSVTVEGDRPHDEIARFSHLPYLLCIEKDAP